MRIPGDLDYRKVAGLTRESVERLEKMKPRTLGEARKLRGLTPAAFQNLALHLEIQAKKKAHRPAVSRGTGPIDE